MKVLIFEGWLNPMQLGTGLEIAEIEAERGNSVQYVNIGEHLPYREWDLPLDGSPLETFYNSTSVKKTLNEVEQVLSDSIAMSRDTLLDKNEMKALDENLIFRNIQELKDYTWDNMDIGMGVASSLISVTKNMEPNTTGEHLKLAQRIMHTSKIMAESFKKWLAKVKPDLVYFRNGRVATYRPIFRICQRENINFLIHDRGCDKYHYKLTPDLTHNFDLATEEIIEKWEAEPDEEKKIEIATNYFERREKGNPGGFRNFVKHQEKNTLPSNWDEKKRNIVFYNSSISEFAAINKGDKNNSIFKTQLESIYFVADSIKNDENSHLFIRLHPNLLNQAQAEKDLWLSISHPKITLIPPESKIDTYFLMEKSDLVVIYLSTTGIEAAFRKKPVILLNKSKYYRLGSTYYPESKEELVSLLEDKQLEPKPILGALKYGYYMSTFGEKFRFFEPFNYAKGKFKSVELRNYPTLIGYLRRFTKKLGIK